MSDNTKSQIYGANRRFKNRPEADSLKAKFSKKGYKTVLIEVKPKNNEPLFKVAVGDSAQEATQNCSPSRSRESEGLQTFVTLR